MTLYRTLTITGYQLLILIYRPRNEGLKAWVALAKEKITQIQFSAEPFIEHATLWLESRDLTNCLKRVKNEQKFALAGNVVNDGDFRLTK